MRKPCRFSCSIELPGRTVRVECIIWPAKAAPHAGPDSPDYMKPGKRSWVDALRIFADRIEVTDTFSPQTLSRIREAVRKASRLPPSPARYRLSLIEPAAFEHQFPLQIGGHRAQ